MTWTHFWDMHSGGSLKEKQQHIYIEASEAEAKVIFYNRFGHNPERVSCTCCGEDYAIDENESLAQLTGFHRGCRAIETKRGEDGLYKNDDPVLKNMYLEPGQKAPKGYKERKPIFYPHRTVEEYLTQEDVLVIYAKDIRPEERTGEVPEQGYVWVGEEDSP